MVPDAHLGVFFEECGVPDGVTTWFHLTVSPLLWTSVRAVTITNWLLVSRLVMVCRIVMRAAVVEPDVRKAN